MVCAAMDITGKGLAHEASPGGHGGIADAQIGQCSLQKAYDGTSTTMRRPYSARGRSCVPVLAGTSLDRIGCSRWPCSHCPLATDTGTSYNILVALSFRRWPDIMAV